MQTAKRPQGAPKGNRNAAGRKGYKQLPRHLYPELVENIIHSKSSPFFVMHDNMMFWHTKATELAGILSNMVIPEGDEEARLEAVKLIKPLIEARQNSQKCAVDCAPYVHARLASIEVKTSTAEHVEKVEPGMTPALAGQAYATMLEASPDDYEDVTEPFSAAAD